MASTELVVSTAGKSGGERGVEAQDPWFGFGDRLKGDEFEKLGVDPNERHILFEFDHEATANFNTCLCVVGASIMSPIVLLLCGACIRTAMLAAAQSRRAVLTERNLLLRWGLYECLCCCWGDHSKTIPLDKVTDLNVERNCCHNCFDVDSISIDNASSSPGMSEMSLLGIQNANTVRKLILQARDQLTYGDSGGAGASSGRIAPPQAYVAAGPSPAQQFQLAQETQQTLSEIRNLLVKMDRHFSEQK